MSDSIRHVRLRFGERSAAEERAVAALDRKIDAVYSEALARERNASWWQEAVSNAVPGLAAELLGPARVVVRPTERELSPLAERFATRAPESLAVFSRRPAVPLESALEGTKRQNFDFAKARVRVGFGRGHLLDVVLHQPGGSGSVHEHEAARALVWALVGERVADDWIRSVTTVPAPRAGPLRVLTTEPAPAGLSLSELASAVDAAVRGVHEGLAQQPLWAEQPSAEWTLLELSPEPAEDFAADDDLVLVSTCRPELLKSHLEHAPFSSARFTRHGEAFFMLKYEDPLDDEARLAARRRLEDRFDLVLARERMGRVIGAGLGIRYSYLYLGVSEPELSLDRLAAVARKLRLAESAWLLPLDSDWAEEWLAIWPGARPPP